MKIHIFGASGSGVTTLGKQLSETVRIPYFDSDDYFWEQTFPAFTLEREPDLRNRMLTNDLQQHTHWILGGSMYVWGCTPDFDLVVFLWVPQDIRIDRLSNREYARYGESIYTDPLRKRLFHEFIEWAKGYDSGYTHASSRTMAAHELWISRLTCPVLEIRGDTTLSSRIGIISNKLHTL